MDDALLSQLRLGLQAIFPGVSERIVPGPGCIQFMQGAKPSTWKTELSKASTKPGRVMI